TFAYTNHTLLPEALECWSLDLIGRVLPRHLEIVYEINARFLVEVRLKCLGYEARVAALSLIDEHGERYVRMANLATVLSHAVNGVTELITEGIKRHVLNDFVWLWRERLTNKTNGVTPRCWLQFSYQCLSDMIVESGCRAWIR